MPDFPQTDAEIEALVRELLAAKIATVEGVGHVFSKPFFVVGKQQYVAALTQEGEAGGNMEVRCIFVEFAGFEDTDKGCDNAPHYKLVYSLHAVQEFVAERKEGGSSTDEFAAFVMNLRAKFLTGRDLEFPDRLRHEPLKQDRRTGLENDPYTQVFGHTAPFTVKVEVVPNG